MPYISNQIRQSHEFCLSQGLCETILQPFLPHWSHFNFNYHGCTVLLVLLWCVVKISVVYLYIHIIYMLLRFMCNMAIM